LLDLLSILRRHKALAAAMLVLAVAGTTALTFLQEPQYQSSVKLLVKLGREFIYRPEAGGRDAFMNRSETLVNSEIEILRSHAVVEAMVRDIGPITLYPDLAGGDARPVDAAIRRFRHTFNVHALPDTDVIEASFLHGDPELAALALNSLVEQFKEAHLEAYSASEAAAFLEAKVSRIRMELSASEAAVVAFERQHEVFALPEPSAVLADERQALGAALRHVEQQLAAANLAMSQEDPALTQARTRLLELKLQEQELLQRYQDGSRRVADVRDNIAVVERFVAAQVRVGSAARARGIAMLKLQQEKLAADLTEIESQLATLPERSRQYRALVRERDGQAELYQSTLRNLEESRFSDEMDRQKIANISVIQPAAPASVAARPRPALNLAVGLFSGAMLGLLAAYLADALPRPAPVAPALQPQHRPTPKPQSRPVAPAGPPRTAPAAAPRPVRRKPARTPGAPVMWVRSGPGSWRRSDPKGVWL
jgi:uncharacterized protein involved in exopolysaccharide biosynthesis